MAKQGKRPEFKLTTLASKRDQIITDPSLV